MVSIAKNPIALGYHPFSNLSYVQIEIDKKEKTPLSLVYIFNQKPALKYFKISAEKLLKENFVPSGQLLLSLTYRLNSTRDYDEVFSCRQLYRITDDIYLFFEYGHQKPHGLLINDHQQHLDSLEGLIICESPEDILNPMMHWLVEVDPIGFEILRRMNRDGFTHTLTLKEELWPIHDSDSYTDKWLNQMTDYADFIELSCTIGNSEDDFFGENFAFTFALKNAVYEADSHTRSDSFLQSNRENWVRPQDRLVEDHDFSEPSQRAKNAIPASNYVLDIPASTQESQFSELPSTAQESIRELINRIKLKFDHEDSEALIYGLEAFVEGSRNYSESELTAELAKLLRMLANS